MEHIMPNRNEATTLKKMTMSVTIALTRTWSRAGIAALTVGCLAMPVLAAPAAEGEGGGGSNLARPETSIPAAIASIIVFCILFYILKSKAWGPIVKGLEDRSIKIRTEIESAENARAQATKALDDYQRELAKARTEAGAMIQQARADAQRVGDELRSKNEAELTSMKNKAKEEIEAAKRSALNELYSETAMLSTQIAGQILHREIKPADYAKLDEESLSQIGSLGDARN